MMQAAKKIPFEDPNVLNGVRALYILSNVIIFGVYMYTKMQIDKKRGMFFLFLFASFMCVRRWLRCGAVTG
jgi:Ca2+/Na+ antiporter